eukprot:EG_transcript_27226
MPALPRKVYGPLALMLPLASVLLLLAYLSTVEPAPLKPWLPAERVAGVSIGNALEAGRDSGGWFVGHFIRGDAQRQAADVEVKWGVHKPGEANGAFASNRHARTMSVLLRGKFQLTFRNREGGSRDVLLSREGDFATWAAGVEHNWKALEPSTVLSVRWPSLPKDQSLR